MLAQIIVEALLDGPRVEMPPDLPEPTKYDPKYHPSLDTHDIALDYIEGQVGRHDWTRNWPQHKKGAGNHLKDRVLKWLLHYEIDHDPQGLIDYIDQHLMNRPGKWL